LSQTAGEKKKRSPWNPRLVGELASDEEEQALAGEEEDEEEEEEEEEVDPPESDYIGSSPEEHFDMTAAAGMKGNTRVMNRDRRYEEEEGSTVAANACMPISPAQHVAPTGPHPNKKGSGWDIYGEQRPQRPQVSHAYVDINARYLEVEGATDRRVRTASIAHKKNSAKAPSVSTVRKMGTHATGRGSELTAKDVLGDLGLANVDEHWKLTSTMQGLGDSNNLVEVTPGACRFGYLRKGSVYRMAFFLRNLDVDVTRFSIAPLNSPYVRIDYKPGHLAPGLAIKIVVEIAATKPAKIQQLIEVKVKAHIIRVPVTGHVLNNDAYDDLDAQSLALHGRRIGRHHEISQANKQGPVELVTDEAYCRKVLGDDDYDPWPLELSA